MEVKNVIELGILPEDANSGVSAISLVDRPAIEVDFLYFKRQDPEDEEEEIMETIPDNIEESYSQEELAIILGLAGMLGVSDNDVHEEEFAKADTKVEFMWKYESSGTAGNHRDFCRHMQSLNRYYSKAEIKAMDNFNPDFGPGIGGGQYNIFKYKGGANCQHYWQKYRVETTGKSVRREQVLPEGSEELLAATPPRTLNGRGYVKRPQRNLPALFNSQFRFADEEKRIVVSPIMIPNMDILRSGPDDITFYVRFSPETIAEIAQKFMKEARTNDMNVDHKSKVDAGSYMYESWIIENGEDKANSKYGFNLPVGTWMGIFKIEDQAIWDRIKSGELKGLSVEGFFVDKEELESEKIYNSIRDIIKNAEIVDMT